MKAVIFPGQGAQYVGMGKSLHDNFPEAKNIFSSIDSILGFKLSEKCFSGTADELKNTATQQLAILAVSLAAFEVFSLEKIKVDYLSGLSLGEYSCLYAAGVVSLKELVILVRERAEAMQKAALSSDSTMLAVIGLDSELLKAESHKKNFYISNVNSAQQIVISLAKKDKEKVKTALEAQGAKVIELEVSGGFHSPFMGPARSHLAKIIEKIEFMDARVPIVSNVTARPHNAGNEIKGNLISQLTSPVLWKDCVEFIRSKGVEVFFEIGPSRVLRGLMRKIDPAIKVLNIEKKEDLGEIKIVRTV